MQVAVIDSGGANLGSVLHGLHRAGVEANLTTDPARIQSASHVILPGVGTAHSAMASLAANGLISVIQNLTQPVLGVCLGLQLLFTDSSEGHKTTPCLGIIDGHVTSLEPHSGIRLPHMGWNRLEWVRQDPICALLDPNDWFYFVHGFCVDATNKAVVATSEHGMAFGAVVRHNNFVACQFHPEKSADAGLRLLRGFLAS